MQERQIGGGDAFGQAACSSVPCVATTQMLRFNALRPLIYNFRILSVFSSSKVQRVGALVNNLGCLGCGLAQRFRILW